MTKTKPEPQKLLAAPKPYEFPFTIGADPEFTMLSGTRPINAKELFEAFFKDTPKEKTRDRQGGFVLLGGSIGWDGHHATGELRPNPSNNPAEVAKNIKNLFKAASDRLPFVDFSTLTVAASTGGHIHLAVPESLNQALENKTPTWATIERAVATFTLLIMMSENMLARELRKRGGNYGELLDYRIDQKFTHKSGAPGYTLEVRGPTAEWLTTEKIALGTLAFMAIAWDSITSQKLDGIKELVFRNRQQAQDAIGPFLSNLANLQRLYLNRMRPFIRKHPAYADYKDALELIMNPERTLAAKREARFSVTEGWGLTVKSKNLKTKTFLDTDGIEEKTAAFPEAVIRNVSQFAWNDDLNVELFATALSKRCVALGWKPQHEYFLFGLKRGINALVMQNETGDFVAGTELFKTKEDHKVMSRKFDRLAPKAPALYQHFINPKTGEIANAGDMRRVMIGIPYAMRQKGDPSDLIRLVLKFEKTPKAFSPLDLSALKDGESSIKATIEREEQAAEDIKKALENGDKARAIDPETVEALREDAREDADGEDETPNEDLVESALEWMADDTDRRDLLIEEYVAQVLEELTPENGAERAVIHEGLEASLAGLPVELSPVTKSYALLYRAGARGRLPVEKADLHFRCSETGTWYLGFEGVHTRATCTRELVQTLLGVSTPEGIDQIGLMARTGAWISARRAPEGGMRPGMARIGAPTLLLINPDNTLPHLL